jgi:hypothetical protein
MIRPVTIVILFLLAYAGCDKTEPVLLSGDIAGMVKIYDENYFPLEDQSGAGVRLLADSIVAQTYTGASGEFLLEDIFYGNYQVELEKEGFVKAYGKYQVHHLGGYSPTLAEYSLYEIPKFETTIDSLRFNGMYERSYIYVTLSGLSGLPRIGYYFRCYCSNTPDVSRDQYVSTNLGWMFSPEMGGLLTEILLDIGDYNFNQLIQDTIYMCVYPQSWGQDWYDFYPESLGSSSNVISFLAQ